MSKLKQISTTALIAYILDAVIGTGAFILSFDTLTHLARMAGINPDLAPIWPIVVDGFIVAATVAIIALAGKPRKVLIYPWFLLLAGASVSTIGNAVHAILTANGSVPVWVSAAVAAVPPLALLAITHLTVVLLNELPAKKQKTKRATNTVVEKATPEQTIAMVAEPVPAEQVPVESQSPHTRLWGAYPGVPATLTPEPAPAVLV